MLVVIAGGLQDGGGIGRQMGYFLNACRENEPTVHYQVVDSRGPQYLGSSPLLILSACIFLGRAIFALVRARLSSPCVAHVNIAGRGSTIRKIVLTSAARLLGMRYVLHLHDYDYGAYYETRGRFLKKRIETVFRRAEAVIVLGRRDLEVIPDLLGVDRQRMIVMHNAVADPKPDPRKQSTSERPCHLLFLGYLSARKGVADLLRALASPTTKPLPWRLTLAGSGAIDEFRNLADEIGVLERLRFTGWIGEAAVSDLCADADVLVLPSYAEGLAMSVLEGLSHGLAVVTTPVGAHSEVIEPEVSGIMVPPGDVDALSEALARVIQDEGLRSRLSKGARDRFIEGFDVGRYAIRLEQFHASLFAPRRDQQKFVEKGLIL
ncbi:glycosyltransferase family 4 protein [Bradyrhizobium sp. LTSPM299]|uniref:glycosyltransferase family 4 protein n=1 Tax=Bradyrhizobium sp. LTSPM299 TaxID=1619233 RepID=UPI0005CB5EEC|nr:glycosyltransferase family 4 protein [Bradyrhizobium sp. LTSPM299]